MYRASLTLLQLEIMNRDEMINGLAALGDWLKYNTESAWRNEHRLLSDHDHNYYQKVIKEAKVELEEGIDIADYYE